MQTINRTISATSHNGFKTGVKEMGKAFAYYGKNTMSYCKGVIRGIPNDILTAIGT